MDRSTNGGRDRQVSRNGSFKFRVDCGPKKKRLWRLPSFASNLNKAQKKSLEEVNAQIGRTEQLIEAQKSTIKKLETQVKANEKSQADDRQRFEKLQGELTKALSDRDRAMDELAKKAQEVKSAPSTAVKVSESEPWKKTNRNKAEPVSPKKVWGAKSTAKKTSSQPDKASESTGSVNREAVAEQTVVPSANTPATASPTPPQTRQLFYLGRRPTLRAVKRCNHRCRSSGSGLTNLSSFRKSDDPIAGQKNGAPDGSSTPIVDNLAIECFEVNVLAHSGCPISAKWIRICMGVSGFEFAFDSW